MNHRAIGVVLLAALLLSSVVGCAASRSHTVRSESRPAGSQIDGADQQLLSIAQGYERRGNFAKARQLYNTVLARHPSLSAARRGLEVVAAREKSRQELRRSAIAGRQNGSHRDSETTLARVDNSQRPISRQQPVSQPVAAPRPQTSTVVIADSHSIEPAGRSSASVPAKTNRQPSPDIAAVEPPSAIPTELSSADRKSSGHSRTVAPPLVVRPVASKTTAPKTAPSASLRELAGSFVLPKTRHVPQPEFDPFPDQPDDGRKTLHFEQHSNVPHTTVIEAYADNPDRAVPELARLLGDEFDSNRSLAAYLLGQAGPAANSTLPSLRRHLKNEPNDLIRVYIAEALLRIDPDDRDGIHFLLRGLDDRRQSIRLLSACALSAAAGNKHEAEAVTALTASLYDTAADVRTMAALSLGEIGSAARAAVPNLTAVLVDEELKVREAAAAALACIAPTANRESTHGATTPAAAPMPPQQMPLPLKPE